MAVNEDIPFTERSNPLTENLDSASASDIVRMLWSVDRELIQETYDGCPGVLSHQIVEELQKLSDLVHERLTKITSDSPRTYIVLSGCGSSGRFAYLAVRKFNRILKQNGFVPNFRYLLAGGDRALFVSIEASEDDANKGVGDLIEVTEDSQGKNLFIGISCGLSAPYVAGQLQYCLENEERFVPVLIGFNPLQLARNSKIKNIDVTFRDIVSTMKEKGCCIVNPVIGPEAVTGSSRMKGGSATLLILNLVCNRALAKASEKCDIDVKNSLVKVLQELEVFYEKNRNDLSNIVEHAGQSLKKGGRIFYLAVDECGIIPMIDASECVPTYGSDFNDVRGFVADGWKLLENKESDLSTEGDEFCISIEDFIKNHLPKVTDDDTFIFISYGLSRAKLLSHSEILKLVNKHPCIFHICVSKERILMKQIFNWSQQEDDKDNKQRVISETSSSDLSELFIKLTVNAISTGAHVLKGKVYKNIMIDLVLGNSKLMERGLKIVQNVSDCNVDTAKESILKAIYLTDTLSVDQMNASTDEHISVAATRTKVIPLSIILCMTKCGIKDAVDMLKSDNVVRNALIKVLPELHPNMNNGGNKDNVN